MKIPHQIITGSAVSCMLLLASVAYASNKVAPREFYDVQPIQALSGGEINGAVILTRNYRNKLLSAIIPFAPDTLMRSHGPAGVAGSLALQIGTADASCPVSGCQNQFASLHPAPPTP
ncbi:MAG: hypothetical protein ACI9GW_003198 [Halieaceae bacterium]|jgi:hypothetical protein